MALVLLAASAGIVATGAVQSETLSGLGTQGDRVLAQSRVAISKEDLGRLLFFDGRLSGDGSTSCATCHAPESGWADGLPLSAGYSRGNLYFRNTPTLINASREEWLDWDGRFAGGDLSSLIRDHIAEAHFMNLDGRLLVERMRQVPEYEEAFEDLYGSEVSYGKVLDALGAFLRTLNSGDHPFLRYREGDADALSAQARAGLELFEGKAGCAQCHGGELLSDGDFHALGVPDNPAIFQEPLRHVTFRRFFRGFGVGEYVALREDPGLSALTFDESDRGKFRTPSLLEVKRTAPYMHNGVLDTLEDVARFYDAGGGEGRNRDSLLRPLGLSDEEIAALVAFLESLGSEEAAFEPPDELPPYQPRTLGDNR